MTSTTEIVRSEALTWPDRARQLAVTTDDDYSMGANLLQDIKGLRSQVDAAFDPIIKAAHAAHKQAVASKKEAEAPLEQAETIIKQAMGRWANQKELKRIEALREAEQARVRAEEAARKAQEAAAREETLKTQEARDRARAQAQAQAQAAEAAQRASEAAMAAAATEHAKPVAEGAVPTKRWSAHVWDLKALVVYVAAHPEYVNLLQANTTALNALVRAQKEGFSMPGVRAVSETSITVR